MGVWVTKGKIYKQSRFLTSALQDNGNNEAVDTEDTSHDDGNKGLVHQVRVSLSNVSNTNTGASSAVSGSHVAENESSTDASEAIDGVGVRIVVCEYKKYKLSAFLIFAFRLTRIGKIVIIRVDMVDHMSGRISITIEQT